MNTLFAILMFLLGIWVLIKVSQGMQTTREERDEMGIKTRDQEIFEDINNED